MKYKYVATSFNGLIYRIKPDWKTTGFNEFMSSSIGKWIEALPSTNYFDKNKDYPLYPLHPRTVKFFEQDGGYNLEYFKKALT